MGEGSWKRNTLFGMVLRIDRRIRIGISTYFLIGAKDVPVEMSLPRRQLPGYML